jgi:DNA-binding PadR family transcriptional regulator
MFALGKGFDYKGRQIKLSAHEFITLLKIRASPAGISGHKLISDLGRTFAGSWSPQSGTMYPILQRLVKEKGLIIEKDVKTPIGPTAKIFVIKDDLGNILDDVVLDTYKPDTTFFANYIEFLFENIETSVKSGLLQGTIGDQLQAVMAELIEKLQAVHDKLGELSTIIPVAESKCLNCNEMLDRAARFCPNCGTELKSREEGFFNSSF